MAAKTERAILSGLTDEPSIPHLRNIDAVRLPDMAGRYDLEPLPEAAPTAELMQVGPDNAGKLDRLTDKALDKLEEILDEPTNFGDARLVQAQLSAAQSVVTATLKADDTRLRSRQTDMLPKLLELIAQKEDIIPKLLERTLG